MKKFWSITLALLLISVTLVSATTMDMRGKITKIKIDYHHRTPLVWDLDCQGFVPLDDVGICTVKPIKSWQLYKFFKPMIE